MSFFDDEDDAIEEEPRRSPRRGGSAGARPGSARAGAARGGSARSGGGRSGGPGRPPTQDAAIERRRIGAVGVLIIVVILMVLLISSCQARNTKNSLVNYNASVSSLITQSDSTSKAVFSALTSGKSGSTIANALATPLLAARRELASAESLSVPGQMAQAQAHLVLALRMRVDGIFEIANAIKEIRGSGSRPSETVAAIAGGAARFYASDVTYKDYATTEISSALHGDNIPVGTGGSVINPGQFLPTLGWLQTSFIDTELGVASPSSAAGGGKNTDAPGIHGDILNSTSVGGTTLSPTGTNTLAASPAPTFALSVTDGGMFNEYKVGCTVSVEGGPSGKSVIGLITPGTTQTCNVTLNSAVTPGIYTVTVTVAKVLGETNIADNTASYSVQFQ